MAKSEKSKLGNWINERFPISQMMRWAFYEEIIGGASFAYCLGSAALFLFMLLVLTGVWQMFVYVPEVDEAYTSLSYLRLQVPFGWLIHGLHYWGSNAFAVVVGLHIIRVFIWGSYKKPREVVWLAGIVLLLLTVGFLFTGPILPWDKKGYWACKVGMSMAGDVPWIGSFLQYLLQGGFTLGQMTLTRMFVNHVAILPFLTVTFIAIHLIAFRVNGGAGPWKEEKRKTKGWFWPDQILIDSIVSVCIFILLVGLIVYFPPDFSGKADPLDMAYTPKPEWTFLFIYDFLRYFPGAWEPVGIVGIPVVIIFLFAILPFIDRGVDRSPAKRKVVMFSGGLFVAIVLAFTVLGYESHLPGKQKTPKLINPVMKKKKEGGASQEKKETHEQPALSGEQVFTKQGCNLCHTDNGTVKNGMLGPDLFLALSKKKGLTREWLHTQIVSPKKHDPKTAMPPFTNIPEKEMTALLDFLQELGKGKKPPSEKKKGSSTAPVKSFAPGQAINIIGDKANGAILFRQYCMECHHHHKNQNAGFQIPSLDPVPKALFDKNPYLFAKKIDPYIQHGVVIPGLSVKMPAFGDEKNLTQAEIADVISYILEMNGVDRAKIIHPGIDPVTFFIIVASVGGVLVIFGLLLLRKR